MLLVKSTVTIAVPPGQTAAPGVQTQIHPSSGSPQSQSETPGTSQDVDTVNVAVTRSSVGFIVSPGLVLTRLRSQFGGLAGITCFVFVTLISGVPSPFLSFSINSFAR